MQYTIDGKDVTAGIGAEAFNDLTRNKASGEYSHAEGAYATASGDYSHAEGSAATASGDYSHAEGSMAIASGSCSHAEGQNTEAKGFLSHTEGWGTKAASKYQHVQGKLNVVDSSDTYAFIIGNGTADNARHNAFAIDWNGLIYVDGASTGVDVSALAPQSTTYTKNEVDTALATKLNTSDVDVDISSTSTNPVQNKVIQAPLARLVDAGAKNLLKITATSQTINGVTFTVNDDGTITVNGTANSVATFFASTDIPASMLRSGKFIGCPAGGSSSTYQMMLEQNSNPYSLIASDRGSGYDLSYTGNINADCYIQIKSGVTVNNLVFKPMICTAEDYKISPEFVPYAKSNYELTQDVRPIPSLVDRGAKNLAKFDIWAKQCSLVRGTKTIGSDGAITITATSSDCYTLFSPTDFPVECRIPVTPDHEMVATWTASETGSGNKYLYIFPNGGTTGFVATKASDGIMRFTVPKNCTYITWRIGCSTSGDTLTINNFMICTKADYDASSAYVPYAFPNTTITPALIKQVNEGAKNLVIDFGKIENNGCIFTYGSDGRITVTGTKSTALAMVEFISNQNLSNYGLSAGDKIVVVSDNENVGVEVIFADDQGTADPSISIYNEIRTITIPSGRTRWYLRLQIKPDIRGTINESTKPMVCDKKLYDIDPTVTPYAMSNLELTKKVTELGVKLITVNLSERTFTKSAFGLYYSDKIDLSGSFSELYAATLQTFTGISNISIQPMLQNATMGLYLTVCDPSSPSTLSFTSGSIGFMIFGRLK